MVIVYGGVGFCFFFQLLNICIHGNYFFTIESITFPHRKKPKTVYGVLITDLGRVGVSFPFFFC